MPRNWTAKDERKYQHVKRSELRKGKSLRTAKRIAAARVNKDRKRRKRKRRK